MVVLGLSMILIGTGWWAISLFLFSKAYRAYYLTLKRKYPGRFTSLMTKDPLVDAYGEWIRWPVGSVYLFIDAFSRSSADPVEVAVQKARIRRYLIHFGVAVVFTFSLAILFPLSTS
jgi:hypothetical protein